MSRFCYAIYAQKSEIGYLFKKYRKICSIKKDYFLKKKFIISRKSQNHCQSKYRIELVFTLNGAQQIN